MHGFRAKISALLDSASKSRIFKKIDITGVQLKPWCGGSVKLLLPDISTKNANPCNDVIGTFVYFWFQPIMVIKEIAM